MDNENKILQEQSKRRLKKARQVATLVGTYAALYLCKEPRHTSD